VPRVTWSRRSRTDLVELRRFVKNPAKAKAVAARLLAIAEHLEKHPELGHVGVVPGTRELIVDGTPFILIYTVSDDRNDVIVLGVVDGRRDWK
jgi:toxin ParE1/3/4